MIILVGLSLCNWAIDIGRPFSSFSPVNGFIYVFLVNFFVLMDAVMLKSRYLMIGVGLTFVVLNLYNIYGSRSANGIWHLVSVFADLSPSWLEEDFEHIFMFSAPL